jgi:hypothetical protein
MRHHGLPLLPNPTQDERDPLRWPVWLKRCAIVTTSMTNFVTNMAGAGLSVAVPELIQEYHKPESAVVQLLTVGSPFNQSDYSSLLMVRRLGSITSCF